MIPRLEIHFDREERRWFREGMAMNDKMSRANVLNEPRSLNDREEFLLNHCRSGIQLVLQALDLKPLTGVGMIVYNCHTVMNAICQAGCKPVFVDVTDGMTIDMEDLARKREQMQVLIVTHLFGIVNDVKEIKRRYPDLIIIEDCAHCFEHEIDGEFGVYSVGQGKFPSIGDGGVLRTIEDFRLKIEELYAQLPKYSKKQERKLYVRLWMKAMMYSPCFYWLTRKLKRKRGEMDVREEVTMRKMSRGIANILAHKRAEYPAAVQERLQRAQHKGEGLKVNGEWLVGENAFMALVRCEDPAALKAVYAAKGIETETHFKHCIDWAAQFGYERGNCPNAEELTKHLLMIPTYTSI